MAAFKHLGGSAIGSVELRVAQVPLEEVLETAELNLALVSLAKGKGLLRRFLFVRGFGVCMWVRARIRCRGLRVSRRLCRLYVGPAGDT